MAGPSSVYAYMLVRRGNPFSSVIPVRPEPEVHAVSAIIAISSATLGLVGSGRLIETDRNQPRNFTTLGEIFNRRNLTKTFVF